MLIFNTDPAAAAFGLPVMKKVMETSGTTATTPCPPLPSLPPPAPAAAPFGMVTAAFGLSMSNTCAKCGITFRMTSDLVYHMRTHHSRQERPM